MSIRATDIAHKPKLDPIAIRNCVFMGFLPFVQFQLKSIQKIKTQTKVGSLDHIQFIWSWVCCGRRSLILFRPNQQSTSTFVLVDESGQSTIQPSCERIYTLDFPSAELLQG
jgi:hypothetical protein